MMAARRDDRLLDSCRRYAAAALQRVRDRQADDPALAALLRSVAQRRRGQQARLDSLAAKTAPAPIVDAARILAIEQPTPELRILRLSRPPGFRYRAGQHVKLRLDGVRRPYSIVSAPHEPALEFFIDLAPGGAASMVMRRLRVGDPVRLGDASGGLSLDPARRRHLVVATVTGVAPFVSLLRERLRAPGSDELHLLHGASFQDELAYADELRALAEGSRGRFHYTPAVSRPQDPRNRGWNGATGRVSELFEPYLRRHGMQPADTALYACGQPDMVAGVVERGTARGYPVWAEPY